MRQPGQAQELICAFCDGRTPIKALRGAEDEGLSTPPFFEVGECLALLGGALGVALL